MGIFNTFKEKSIKNNGLIERSKAMIKKDNEYLDDLSDFIDPSFELEVKERYGALIDDINKSIKFFTPHRTKLIRSKKMLDKVVTEIDLSINNHNNIVAQQRIKDASKIIEPVENRKLDDQQMMCIVKNVHNHLVVAGAGTGKTTTIVGKIKYILLSGQYKAQDILVLSFTNKSASEMSERILNETKSNIEVSTFHKLGLNIITKVDGIVPKISKINVNKFIKENLKTLLVDQSYKNKLCRFLHYRIEYQKTEFDFTSMTEYHKYLETHPPKTLRGEIVKSYGELQIANFLFINGINYEYEKEYEIDTRTENKAQYYPDFYLPDYQIYIEYFGIDVNGNVPSYFTSTTPGKSAKEEYLEGINWKRNIHEQNNTTMIECFAYEKMINELEDKLKERLTDRGVHISPIDTDTLWSIITNNSENDVLSGVAEIFGTVINLIKSNNISFQEYERKCSSSTFGKRNLEVASLIKPIFETYTNKLKENEEIDFNDMINKATAYVQEGKYINPYKYVIVDEYQDISKARFSLLKALRDTNDYDLFCVGDDWQSIYRFAGSDMAYILNFSNFWGPTEISKIETTYRFSKSLIDISGSFVMKNPNQIKKNIQGKENKYGFALGVIKGYTEDYAVQFMLNKLDELPANKSVFFIGRYSFVMKILENTSQLHCSYDNTNGTIKITYSKRKDLKITFITAHKSKGLQADYVFILNNKDRGMGFPSKIQEDPIVDLLLEANETFPFAEERRLFYVAMTRAKIKTFLVTIDGNESVFVSELKDQYENELKTERFTCPWCGGKLVKKKGPYGDFIGCLNFKTSGCKFTRNLQSRSSK